MTQDKSLLSQKPTKRRAQKTSRNFTQSQQLATTKDYSATKNIFFGKQEGFATGYNELSGEFKLNEILDMSNPKRDRVRSFTNLGKYLFNEGGKRNSKDPKNATNYKFEGFDFNLVDQRVP